MTNYCFIRTGYKPVHENYASEEVIRSCFGLCQENVRAELERFFLSKRPAVEFEFSSPWHKVRIERM